MLFLGSYFPLSVILLLQDIKEDSWRLRLCRPFQASACVLPILTNPARTLVLVIICAVSLVICLWLLRKLPGKTELVVLDAKTVPNDLINYVFPYVVSFMGLDVGVNGKFYGFLLFIGWMFLITYRSGQILMNPLLLVVGWQLYELNVTIKGSNKRCVRALSRDRVVEGDVLNSCLVQGIYVLHKGDDK